MRVGTERQATGKARLHKYVVTEQVEQTVPVRKEKARIVREPVDESTNDQAMRGDELTEAEHEVTNWSLEPGTPLATAGTILTMAPPLAILGSVAVHF